LAFRDYFLAYYLEALLLECRIIFLLLCPVSLETYPFSFGWVFANNYAKIINQALGLNSFKTLYPAGAEEEENRFTSEYDSMEEARRPTRRSPSV